MGKAIQISAHGAGGAANGIATGINWEQVDFKSESGRAELIKALSGYYGDVAQAHAYGKTVNAMRDAQAAAYKAMQMKFTRPGHLGNLPGSTDLDVNFFGPQVDNGWQSIFRYVDRRNSKNSVYNIGNVNAQSIVFEQSKPGQPVKVRKVSDSAPVSVASVTYDGALGIDDDASRFDEFDVFEENTQKVPSVWDDKLADIHYALITAMGAGINETWDTDLINTLNSAGAQIMEDVGDQYALGENPTFTLLYNHRNWNLVMQALASNFNLPNDNNSAKQLQWNIIPVPTRKIATTSLYLSLPGNDNVSVEWDSLFSEYGRDFVRGADTFVWRARRNAAIGNVSQHRRITPA